MLQRKEIQVVEDRITALLGKQGMLERVVFETHREVWPPLASIPI
ncbi:MAG TPA: hypothetical protein VHZ51_14850 [Ktedonobacteraceae bacterium]|jgi:hypothetical protein|nr:hypothetical protein [Ktedonobacteraceae bacterium]